MNRQIQRKKWEGVEGKRAVGSTRNKPVGEEGRIAE